MVVRPEPSSTPRPKKGLEPLDASALATTIAQHSLIDPTEGSGVDNGAFDLADALRGVEPGSRRPLIGVNGRTISAEDFLRSTLGGGWARVRRPTQSRPVVTAAVGGWLHKNGCDQLGTETSRTLPTAKTQFTIETGKTTVAVPNSSFSASVTSISNEKDKSLIEIPFQTSENANNNKESNSNASSPSKLLQKTLEKKMDSGSAQWIGNQNVVGASSVAQTMVRVGCAAATPSSSARSTVQSSGLHKVVISDSTDTVVSVSSVAVAPRVSAVVASPITMAVTVSAAPSPLVSALSKVSSVRIVPSPRGTPTPSIVGLSVPPSITSVDDSTVAASSRRPSLPKSSQCLRPFDAMKRRIHNMKTGGGSTSSTPPSATPQQLSPSTSPAPHNSLNAGDSPPITSGDPLRGDNPAAVPPSMPTEGRRERRRERRERRRERRAHRSTGGPQTEVDPPRNSAAPSHLPDLLHSHVPPPYSTLPGGPRGLGGLLAPPPIVPPLPMQLPPPGQPPPMGSMMPYPPPGGAVLRPPTLTDAPPWGFFGSHRWRGSAHRMGAYLGADEEAKSCCGLLVTQAVSIRWFIIMIAFVGLCCTVVGTVLGAVNTNTSEYVTITLLMIGVGIVLITVSGVAWHLTSRDAPCRVMLGLAPRDPNARGGADPRRLMARMAPSFGRPHHPYATMLYPEFQHRPPPPSYQASMQDYRLRLFLLDRQNGAPPPPAVGVGTLPSPPPLYHSGHYNPRGLMSGTLGRESDCSRPPSYRSRDGSMTQYPSATPSANPSGVNTLAPPAHSRHPSCLSFLSRDGSASLKSAEAVVITAPPPVATGSSKNNADHRVRIVQTTDCSTVVASEAVVVTVSGATVLPPPQVSVLAHL